jgi:hypothetical protein
LLSFKSNRREIYYEQFSHPHPVIRVMWIIFSIVGYCTRSLEAKEIKLEFNVREIIDETLNFCEKIIDLFFEDKPMDNFIDSLNVEAINIMAYLTKFQQLKENDKSLAVHKWNQIAKDIQDKISRNDG